MLGGLYLTLTLPLVVGGMPGELPAGWVEVAPKGGGFAAAMPGTPTEDRQRVRTATGELEVTLHVLEAAGEVTYLVSHSDLPAKEVTSGREQKRLDHARDGAVANARGKLRSEKKLELDSYPGRELVIETSREVVIRMRIYAVGQRLYQVVTMGPGAHHQSRDAGRFLDSFRLIK